jgi:hypothetical protein
MPGIHELMQGVPPAIFLLMVGLPVAMTVAAVAVGWYARRELGRRRTAQTHPSRLTEDPLHAGLTVAIVPFGFALLMLWARFG